MKSQETYTWLDNLHREHVQWLLENCQEGDAKAIQECWTPFAWEVSRPGSSFDKKILSDFALQGLRRQVADFQTSLSGESPDDAEYKTWSIRPIAYATHWLSKCATADQMKGVLDYLREFGEWAWSQPKVGREGNMGFLNFRALETEIFIHLGMATGDDIWQERARAYLVQLLPQHYPSGAIPYHTGLWIWGRKPSTHYALTVLEAFALASHVLKMEGAKKVFLKAMEFYATVTDHQGVPMTTSFESCAKGARNQVIRDQFRLLEYARRLGAGGNVPAMAAQGLARLCERLNNPGAPSSKLDLPVRYWGDEWTSATTLLSGLSRLGMNDLPEYPASKERSQRYVFEDISTAVVHKRDSTVVGTLLGGYNTPLAVQWGDLNIMGLGPELTDQPTYRHFGLNCVDRIPWNTNVELESAWSSKEAVALRGSVPTRYFERSGEAGKRICFPLNICLVLSPRRAILCVEPLDGELADASHYHFTLMVDSLLRSTHPVEWYLGNKRQSLPEESCQPLPCAPLRFVSPDTGKSMVIRLLSPRLPEIVFQGTQCDADRFKDIPLRKKLAQCLPRYHLTAWRFLFAGKGATPHIFQVDLLEKNETLPQKISVAAIRKSMFTAPLVDVVRQVSAD